MTASVSENGDHINTDNYLLAAYHDEKCVGFTESLVFPLNGNRIFPLMIYGNEDNHLLEFKLYDTISKTYYEINEKLTFSSDMHLGDGLDPIQLHVTHAPIEYSVGLPYPNPFNPIVNFDLTLAEESHVRVSIYDIAGHKVSTVHDGILDTKKHKIFWMANDHASGIYFFKIELENQSPIHKKIILLK